MEKFIICNKIYNKKDNVIVRYSKQMQIYIFLYKLIFRYSKIS